MLSDFGIIVKERAVVELTKMGLTVKIRVDILRFPPKLKNVLSASRYHLSVVTFTAKNLGMTVKLAFLIEHQQS
jgi:hypothetical protein